jgi:hypothetical protein
LVFLLTEHSKGLAPLGAMPTTVQIARIKGTRKRCKRPFRGELRARPLLANLMANRQSGTLRLLKFQACLLDDGCPLRFEGVEIGLGLRKVSRDRVGLGG